MLCFPSTYLLSLLLLFLFFLSQTLRLKSVSIRWISFPSGTITWIRKCVQNLHLQSAEEQMGKILFLSSLALYISDVWLLSSDTQVCFSQKLLLIFFFFLYIYFLNYSTAKLEVTRCFFTLRVCVSLTIDSDLFVRKCNRKGGLILWSSQASGRSENMFSSRTVPFTRRFQSLNGLRGQ